MTDVDLDCDSGFIPPFKLDTIKIPSKSPSWKLDAWKFVPLKIRAPHAVIIMAHGFSANKNMALRTYGEAFAEAGYACIVFDYRRWGDSDGSPRHCLYISEQLDDYRSVISWVRHQQEFDSKRVILWGTSFSGGHIIILAAEKNLHIACAIGQCPYTGDSPLPTFSSLLKTASYGVADLFRQSVGLSPLYIPAYAYPSEMGALTAKGSVEGIKKLVEDKRHFPNEISASSIFEVPFYRPASKAAQVACPMLLVIPEEDALCPPEVALDVVKASENARMARTAGGHFDLYPGGPAFVKAFEAELLFLRKHVLVS